MEQKLHTPEGVRDIYNKECEIKLTLQKKLGTVLHSYGYQDIQTPTFEYFDVFRKEIGSTSAREMYKFLIGREISLHYARISRLPLPEPLQRFLRQKIFQSACAMPAILLSTIPVIRDG